MIKVALHGVKFFAYHGFYPEEQRIGNHFVVDIEVEFDARQKIVDDRLDHTVNYEILFEILQKEMKQPRKLLETVVQSINQETLKAYPFLLRIRTGIKKLHPPMGGQIEHSFVEISYSKPHEL